MEAVKTIAEELLKKEVLYKDDMERLLGKRPFVEDYPSEEAPPIAGVEPEIYPA